jgi:hypothetical protein
LANVSQALNPPKLPLQSWLQELVDQLDEAKIASARLGALANFEDPKMDTRLLTDLHIWLETMEWMRQTGQY